MHCSVREFLLSHSGNDLLCIFLMLKLFNHKKKSLCRIFLKIREIIFTTFALAFRFTSGCEFFV